MASSEGGINDIPFHGGGLIPGSGGGRTDRLPLVVANDSHVVTSDVISGMGQGNTMNGWRNLMGALRYGPYGVPSPTKISGDGSPKAPPVPRGAIAGYGSTEKIEEKRGGAAHKGVSILGASGEAVIPFHDWVSRDPVDGKLLRAPRRAVPRSGLVRDPWQSPDRGADRQERSRRS